jgi:hypothetical protein
MSTEVAQLLAQRSRITCELDEQRFFRSLRQVSTLTRVQYSWYIQQGFDLNAP